MSFGPSRPPLSSVIPTSFPGMPVLTTSRTLFAVAIASDTWAMADRNVLGTALEPCGTELLTGFHRDGCCTTGPEDIGSHTICAVLTAEFLDHQRGIGNDLTTPMPRYSFPGLVPGDRWCVTASDWLRA